MSSDIRYPRAASRPAVQPHSGKCKVLLILKPGTWNTPQHVTRIKQRGRTFHTSQVWVRVSVPPFFLFYLSLGFRGRYRGVLEFLVLVHAVN